MHKAATATYISCVIGFKNAIADIDNKVKNWHIIIQDFLLLNPNKFGFVLSIIGAQAYLNEYGIPTSAKSPIVVKLIPCSVSIVVKVDAGKERGIPHMHDRRNNPMNLGRK